MSGNLQESIGGAPSEHNNTENTWAPPDWEWGETPDNDIPYLFTPLQEGFDLKALTEWLERHLNEGSLIPDPNAKCTFFPGMSVRNAFRLVRDLCRRNPDWNPILETPLKYDPITLLDELNELKRIHDWCINLQLRSNNPADWTQRIQVDVITFSIKLDNTVYQVTPDQASYVQELVEKKGLWISSKKMASVISRPDQIRKKLPNPIKKITEAKKGGGHRLRIEDLE